jgi:hypothetical protein
MADIIQGNGKITIDGSGVEEIVFIGSRSAKSPASW